MKEWLRIFYEEYVCLNLKEFSNIGIDLEIGKIFLAGAIALAVCTVVLDLRHRCSYALIKQLMRHDAVKEENAKTLTELGLVNNRQLKRLLSDSGRLRSIVARVGEVKLSSEEYAECERKLEEAMAKGIKVKESEIFGTEIDFESARFFVREESMPAAIKIFHGADVSLVRTVLRSVLIVIVSVIAVILMPSVLEWINGVIV